MLCLTVSRYFIITHNPEELHRQCSELQCPYRSHTSDPASAGPLGPAPGYLLFNLEGAGICTFTPK